MNNISFDNPWLLFLAIPLLAAVVVPFAVTVRRDNANAHNITSCILHVIICVCITLVISGMQLETVITETDVYVLADISYSADRNLDDVQERLDEISGKLPANSKMGVICFGRNYQLISDLGDGVPQVSSADRVDRSATDIASALRYAGNLFDDGVIKRIIIITDGAETVSSSNIIRVVGALQESGVYVDAVYIDDNIPDGVKEIQVDGVAAAGSTYLGKTEQAEVLVRANCGAGVTVNGYINLYRDGVRIDRFTAQFASGLNTFSVNLSTDAAGKFGYEVTAEPAEAQNDTSPYNNAYLFTQTVTDERKVLFLGGTADDVAAGRSIYGSDDVDCFTHAEANAVPLTIEELCVYDEIVMSNFDVRTMRSATVFLNSVSTLINDFSKTFTTYGNTYIQEDNGDARNEPLRLLAELLPVEIGNFAQEDRLVAIILDISTSMNFSGRMPIAKRAAIELLNVLTPRDTVMVIGFSGGVTELLPPMRLTSPGVIIRAINEAQAENETNLSAALRHTEELMPRRFRNRQVLIISDGNNPAGDEASARQYADSLKDKGVALSALGIYPTDYGDGFLNGLVTGNNQVEGSFYRKIVRESDIDFTIQSINEENQKIEFNAAEDDFNDSYRVVSSRPDAEELKDVGGIGAVYGFWSCRAKEGEATTVLSVVYNRDVVTEITVPLYAYSGGDGKGKAVSFLSDITSGWISGWGEGSEGRKFLSNIPKATLPDERINTPFVIGIERNVNSMTVRVNASTSLQNGADFTVTVTDPGGLVTTKDFAFDSSTYFANFNTDVPGVYSVHISYSYNGTHYESETEYALSYYAEYNSFATYTQSSLYRLLTASGNIIDPDEVERLENSDSAYTSYIFDFTMPLMIVCAVLFMADIIIRQLKWKDVTSFFKGLFRRRK